MNWRPRIGLFTPRFALFDSGMPEGFREDRLGYAERARTVVAGFGDVVPSGIVETRADAQELGARWSSTRLDAIVYWPTMAAPPEWLEVVLDAVGDVPVIVVAAQEAATIVSPYDTEQATRRSQPVGAVMATNVLWRRGCPFEVVVGVVDGDVPSRLGRAVRIVSAVQAVRTGTLGLVGEAIDGYSDVAVRSEDLRRLGVQCVDLSDELVEEFGKATQQDADTLRANITAVVDEGDVPESVMVPSLRLASALACLVDRHGLVGGAVNCHGPALRGCEAIGLPACLAVSALSVAGAPFSCTGDIPAALGLVIGHHLAGAALYCELYQLDLEADVVLVANGGEGDWGMRRQGAPVRLHVEDHYEGLQGPGVASSFAIREGPATLVSVSPGPTAGGWRLVLAEGEIHPSPHHELEGPHGLFRFMSRADRGYAAWCEMGASHHAVLVPGLRAGDFSSVGRWLKVDCVTVNANSRAEHPGASPLPDLPD